MLNALIQIHPATRMLVLIWLGAVMQYMSHPLLLCTTLLTVLPATLFYFSEFSRLLRKTRVLLLMIMILYATSTPGEYVMPGISLWLNVSKEGLLHGAEQVFKILVMLASLSIFLGTTQRDAILSGLYTLLLPTRILSWNVDSMIARIYLTLEYVENSKNSFEIRSLPNLLSQPTELFSQQAGIEEVRFELAKMRQIDCWICILMLITLVIELA